MPELLKKGIPILLVLCLMIAPAVSGALTQPSDMIEAAFSMLEEGNPFVARYSQLTGREIRLLFPRGVGISISPIPTILSRNAKSHPATSAKE